MKANKAKKGEKKKNLKHPPARVGAYSGASVGVATRGDDEEPAEGPIPSAKR